MLIEVFDCLGTQLVENTAHFDPFTRMRIRAILGCDQGDTVWLAFFQDVAVNDNYIYSWRQLEMPMVIVCKPASAGESCPSQAWNGSWGFLGF
jgi:hypothetical protein